MSLNNSHSSLPDFRAVELNTFALDVLQYSGLNAGGTMTQISLSSLSFGALTILFSTSAYFLSSSGSTTQTNGRMLLFGTLLLFVSTSTYMAALIWAWSDGNHLISKAVDGLFSPSYDGREEMAAFEHVIHKQSWMITVALGVNLVTGDAIVWWRACVIWQCKVVNWIGVLLLTFTTICGAVGMVKSPSPQTTGIVFLIQGNAFAQTAAVLSLSTNLLATSLIAYKAWEHRQLMKQHFAEDMTTSRVFKALVLLIESGCIYCVLLVFVIVYQAQPTTAQSNPDMVYITVAADFTYGCFVPLVAIYPTTIIVLVALKRSPLDAARLGPRAHQAHDGHGSGIAERGTRSTIVFNHSSFRSAGGVEMESTTEGIFGGDRWSRHSLKTLMNEKEVEAVGNRLA